MFNTRRPWFVSAVLAALVAALGLAACGGGGSGANVDQVLKETFSGNKKVRSGKVDLTLSIKAEGTRNLGGPIELKLTGPLQSQGPKQLPKFDFDLTLSASGQTFKAGAVSTGDAGFLKFQGQAYTVPAQIFAQFKQGFERAQAQKNGSQNQSFASLGVNPKNWLKDPKDQGDADVGGAKTIHISAGVDVGKLLDDVNQILTRARGQLGGQAARLPTQITASQRQAVKDAVKEVSFDVYTGKDDKTLRRMKIKLKFKVSQKQQSKAQGLTGGEIAFDLVLNELNQPQTVNPPANPRPFTELTTALRGVLGGLGGLGGTGGTPGATTTVPPPSGGATGGDRNAQLYLQCLQQAGGDVAKAQKCAVLLKTG